jgi:hypothetical protein
VCNEASALGGVRWSAPQPPNGRTWTRRIEAGCEPLAHRGQKLPLEHWILVGTVTFRGWINQTSAGGDGVVHREVALSNDREAVARGGAVMHKLWACGGARAVSALTEQAGDFKFV